MPSAAVCGPSSATGASYSLQLRPQPNWSSGHIALVAIGIAEMLSGVGDAVELVVGQVLRQPVATVVGEIKLLRYRVEIKPDRIADSAHMGFRPAAVEVHAPDLSVGVGRKADVTGRPDVDVELVVGSHRDEFPTVRLVVGELIVDNDGLRRIIEVVFDLFELRNFGAFGDVERALVEGEAVRPVQARGDDLELAFSILLDDGVNLVEEAVADEDRALLAEPQRARIRHAAHEHV